MSETTSLPIVNPETAADNVSGNTNADGGAQQYLTQEGLEKYLYDEQIKQMPAQHGALPPHYYYPNDNSNVIKGHTQTPIGSFALVSPSARFPFSVLDAVEKENAAKKAQAWIEENKPISRPDLLMLDNKVWNRDWLRYQNNKYESAIQEAYEHTGSYGKARLLLQQEGTLEKINAELVADQQLFNETFKKAGGIIEASKDPSANYVSSHSLDAARKYFESSWGDFESPEERYNASLKARDEFVTAVGMETASEHVVKKWNDTIIQDQTLYQTFAQGGKAINTAITHAYQQAEVGGMSAADAMWIDFDRQTRSSYDAAYGAMGKEEEWAKPTYEQYRDFVTSSIKDVVKWNEKNVSQSAAMHQAYANVWEREQIKKLEELQLSASMVQVGNRNVKVVGLPQTSQAGKKFTITQGDGRTAFRINESGGLESFNKHINGEAIALMNYTDPRTGETHTGFLVSNDESVKRTVESGGTIDQYSFAKGGVVLVPAGEYWNQYSAYLHNNNFSVNINDLQNVMQDVTGVDGRGFQGQEQLPTGGKPTGQYNPSSTVNETTQTTGRSSGSSSGGGASKGGGSYDNL
jgi:hypothetical protein